METIKRCVTCAYGSFGDATEGECKSTPPAIVRWDGTCDKWAERNKPVLPQWRSHKIVSAAKITRIREGRDGFTTLELDGKYEVLVNDAWRMRDVMAVGGYYVVYESGYASYSPGEWFEGGYTRIE